MYIATVRAKSASSSESRSGKNPLATVVGKYTCSQPAARAPAP
jgi:hypothetical protein